MPCNSEQYREQETAYLCGICKPLQRSATPDRTLVKRLGQRFESARRLSLFGLNKPNTRNVRSLRATGGGFLTPPRWTRTSFFLSSSREVTPLNYEGTIGASDIRIASLVLCSSRKGPGSREPEPLHLPRKGF